MKSFTIHISETIVHKTRVIEVAFDPSDATLQDARAHRLRLWRVILAAVGVVVTLVGLIFSRCAMAA